MTDEALLEQAAEALKERLGVLGYLRYLRLTQSGKGEFRELRRGWVDTGAEDVLRAVRGSRAKARASER